MNNPVVYDYKGSEISFISGDSVMINATQMAKPFGKLVGDWVRLKSTTEFMKALSTDMQIHISALIQTVKGGNGEQGTWMHEDVALEFARWLSPAFAIWCNKKIKELMRTGVATVSNERGLLRYTQFLQQRYGQRNTTTLKQIDILKWFLRWAKRKGFNTTLDFEQFRPKLKTAARKVVFLDWDELMALYNFKLPPGKKYLERVRDVFCLCCFTGLRYSDVANLKKSDIADGCITITTVKTHDTLTIELNDYSAEILSRYSATDCGGDAAMPVISNQRMNDYLKELGEVCGIDTPVTMTYYKGGQRHDETHPKYELLTTHCGRRTFICNALMLGIPPEIVMKWTGHSDYKAMKPYIAVSDNAKRKAMSLFNKKKD